MHQGSAACCEHFMYIYAERAYRCTQGYSLRILCLRSIYGVLQSTCKPEPLNCILLISKRAHIKWKNNMPEVWWCDFAQNIKHYYVRQAIYTVRLLRANLRRHSIRYSNLELIKTRISVSLWTHSKRAKEGYEIVFT